MRRHSQMIEVRPGDVVGDIRHAQELMEESRTSSVSLYKGRHFEFVACYVCGRPRWLSYRNRGDYKRCKSCGQDNTRNSYSVAPGVPTRNMEPLCPIASGMPTAPLEDKNRGPEDYRWQCTRCGTSTEGTPGKYLNFCRQHPHTKDCKVVLVDQTGEMVATSIADARHKGLMLKSRVIPSESEGLPPVQGEGRPIDSKGVGSQCPDDRITAEDLAEAILERYTQMKIRFANVRQENKGLVEENRIMRKRLEAIEEKVRTDFSHKIARALAEPGD